MINKNNGKEEYPLIKKLSDVNMFFRFFLSDLPKIKKISFFNLNDKAKFCFFARETGQWLNILGLEYNIPKHVKALTRSIINGF